MHDKVIVRKRFEKYRQYAQLEIEHLRAMTIEDRYAVLIRLMSSAKWPKRESASDRAVRAKWIELNRKYGSL